MTANMTSQAGSALVDPEYRRQMQALKDVTAALNGTPSSPVVFSTDPESVLNGEEAAKPLRTGQVFANARAPLGELWGTLSELEDRLGERLRGMPSGAVIAIGQTGWSLVETEEELALATGQVIEGKLVEPQSRFDFDLDWVDIEESDLEARIATLQDALGRLDEGLSLVPQAEVSAALIEGLRAQVLRADQNATFVDVGVSKVSRTYVGPVTARLDGQAPAYAQHIGRSVYAIHLMKAPPHVAGEIVEVNYQGQQPGVVKVERAGSLER